MSGAEHVNEDVLERYAMRSLSEPEAEAVEDHIALCTHCLDRLDETTAYINAMKGAAKSPPLDEVVQRRLPTPIRRRWTIPVWGSGAVAAAGLLFFALRPGVLPPATTVVLDGTRGVSAVVHGTGPFDFELFMPVDGKNYHVELVDDSGRKRWEADVPGLKGKLHAVMKQQIAAGQYFLQVTEPASGTQHEFAVRVEQ